MPWNGTAWQAAEHGQGGQPAARVADGTVNLGERAAWGGNPGQKLAALSAVVPSAGTWRLTGTARMDLWDGKGATITLLVLHHGQTAGELARIGLPDHQARQFEVKAVCGPGDRLTMVPRFPGMNQAGTLVLSGVALSQP
jgi:hypothetical protein